MATNSDCQGPWGRTGVLSASLKTQMGSGGNTALLSLAWMGRCQGRCQCRSPGSFAGASPACGQPRAVAGASCSEAGFVGDAAGALPPWVPRSGLCSCSADGRTWSSGGTVLATLPENHHFGKTHQTSELGEIFCRLPASAQNTRNEQGSGSSRRARPGCAAMNIFIINQHEPGELPARGWSLAARGAPLMRIIGSPPGPPPRPN